MEYEEDAALAHHLQAGDVASTQVLVAAFLTLLDPAGALGCDVLTIRKFMLPVIGEDGASIPYASINSYGVLKEALQTLAVSWAVSSVAERQSQEQIDL